MPHNVPPLVKRPTRARAHYTRRQPGTMTRLERKYAEHLQSQLVAGKIADFKYEPFKLRLADRTYFSPDFVVMLPDGTLDVIEVKAYMEEDANIKIKVAAEQFWWFRFYLLTARTKKDGGGFNIRLISTFGGQNQNGNENETKDQDGGRRGANLFA